MVFVLSMKLLDFDFNLPSELIAQEQVVPRDGSKLLVLGRETGEIQHRHFFDIVDFLNKDDILVVNNSKVFPARLLGERVGTGGNAEIFLVEEVRNGVWEVIGKNLKVGNSISFNNSDLRANVITKYDKTSVVEFNISGNDFFVEIEKIGLTPLPPYIKRDEKNQEDKTNYQTVYAKERGSVAAPTAGLHFTKELMQRIKEKGIRVLEITLHVGLGTFAPVKVDDFSKHKMHSEHYSVSPEVMDNIVKAKENNQRIIAVGTTTTRVLENIFRQDNKDCLSGQTDIFISPGFEFKCIDGLITNFHLPKSTLLMLVSAFAGSDNIKKAYACAIENKYRFYSYGDSMFIS